MSEIPVPALNEWLTRYVESFADEYLEHDGERYSVRFAERDETHSTYRVLDLARKEVARFRLTWGIESVEVEVEPEVTEPEPVVEAAPEPEWIEGQWGPTKIRGGYSYERTPCNGDVVYSAADGGEWVVLQSITAANPHKVVVQNPVTGVKFPFGPKWETAVKFKRGEVGKAIGLLQDILGAVEIEDESAKSQANWIIGGRRGGHR